MMIKNLNFFIVLDYDINYDTEHRRTSPGSWGAVDAYGCRNILRDNDVVTKIPDFS